MAGPGRPNTKPGAKPQNTKRTLSRLMQYLSPYKGRLIVVAICILLSSGASVASAYFLKPIIDDYVVPFIGRQNPDLSGFISLLILMGAVYLIGVISSFVYNRIMLHVTHNTLYRVRNDMFSHMQSLPIKYFDTHSHGELMSRYTNDTDTLRQMLSQSLPQLFSSTIQVIGVFVLMLILSPLLTLLVVALIFINIFVIKKIGSKSGYFFKKQQEDLGKVNGYIEEMIEGQKVVKVFCYEDRAQERFDALNDELRGSATSAHTLANILMPLMNNLAYVHYAVTAIVGSLLAINGYFGVGTIASFLQCTRSFSMPITQISQQFNSILMALAGAERIFDLLDAESETDDGYVTLVNARRAEDGTLEETGTRTGLWAWKHPHKDGTLTYTELKGDVQLQEVTFGYEENKTVLRNISLYAKPGQKIAFVGSTGAGKTTITNLLNRFYDVPEGKIRVDGINITKIKKSDLRRSMAMVLQDTHLFTGSVLDNIRYGAMDADDAQCIEAARLVGAHYFISHLPEGYHTELTADGANLSQGQRQLIAIARAAVADPPILILDEATSSIDTRTEQIIERGMDTLMRGRTVFVIAHRLSTVRSSNAIMVLEHGEIIERGDHEDLLKQQGKYYQLYTGAFELE